MQINVQIPAAALTGAVPITVRVGSTATQSGVTVSVN